jgi:hypothetical protein
MLLQAAAYQAAASSLFGNRGRIPLAMIDNVSKRITGEATPTWRGTH